MSAILLAARRQGDRIRIAKAEQEKAVKSLAFAWLIASD
jgi:hypothetical protein